MLLAATVAGFLFHIVRIGTGPAVRPDRTPGPRRLLRAGVTLVAPLAVVAVLGVWTPSVVNEAIAGVVAVLAVVP